MRTVHVVPLGSHTPRKWVTCSVSVAKTVTCTPAGLEELLLQAAAEDVQTQKSCFVCPCMEDQYSFCCVVLLQEPSASWLLTGDLLQWVCSDVEKHHLWVLFCSLAFMVLVILQIRCFSSLLLLRVRRSVSVCCLSFAPRLGALVFLLTWTVTIHAVYSFLLILSQLLAS